MTMSPGVSAIYFTASVPTQSTPRRVHVIDRRRPDHLDAADLAVLDQKRLADQDAARTVKSRIAVLGAVREHTRGHRALIEDDMRPDDAALGVYEWITPLVDVLHHVVEAHFELREAVVPERTDGGRW